MINKTPYQQKLLDPRWQKRRLQILERDEWHCQNCHDNTSTLHVHHRWYESGLEPWEYNDNALCTLCEFCHKEESILQKELPKELFEHFMRCGFLPSDLNRIFERGYDISIPYPMEVLGTAIGFLLSNHKAQQKLIDMLFVDIKKRNKTKCSKGEVEIESDPF